MKEKMASALISTSSCYQILRKTWTGFADIVYCSSSSENDAAYDAPIYSNSLWMAKLLNISTFPCTDKLSFSYFLLLTLWIDHEFHHFDFVCAQILGYAVCIFHITDTKYVSFALVDANLWKAALPLICAWLGFRERVSIPVTVSVCTIDSLWLSVCTICS